MYYKSQQDVLNEVLVVFWDNIFKSVISNIP